MVCVCVDILGVCVSEGGVKQATRITRNAMTYLHAQCQSSKLLKVSRQEGQLLMGEGWPEGRQLKCSQPREAGQCSPCTGLSGRCGQPHSVQCQQTFRGELRWQRCHMLKHSICVIWDGGVFSTGRAVVAAACCVQLQDGHSLRELVVVRGGSVLAAAAAAAAAQGAGGLDCDQLTDGCGRR